MGKSTAVPACAGEDSPVALIAAFRGAAERLDELIAERKYPVDYDGLREASSEVSSLALAIFRTTPFLHQGVKQ